MGVELIEPTHLIIAYGHEDNQHEVKENKESNLYTWCSFLRTCKFHTTLVICCNGHTHEHNN